MNRFRVRKTADTLVIQREEWSFNDPKWQTVITLDAVWAANLAAELDAWLSGTDQIPDLETP